MRLRFISVPLIILGVILLALFVVEIHGPVSVSSTPTTDVLVSVESTVPPIFTGVAGALLLITGLAAEASVHRRDSQDISDDKDETDSLSMFKEWCKEAFRFLTEQHGFVVLREGQQYNPYYVLFGRGDLKIAIKGEGYGSIGSVAYLTVTDLEVPYQCLAPDWEPFFGKSGKRKRKALKKLPERSQREQIFDAAMIIAERDRDILAGDYARLDAASKRIQAIQDRFKAS